MIKTPFLDESTWVDESEYWFAVRDAYPVSPGHTLVLPKRIVRSWFDLEVEEASEVTWLIRSVRRGLMKEFNPDGFTIGINDGEAAGQTVAHAHIHIIPRYRGDVPNPRGGIRGVIPGKADY